MNHSAIAAHKSESAVLKRIYPLLAEIKSRGDEIERGAKVPLDLLIKIEQAGAFRMCLPRSFGGEELSQAQAGRVIEEIAAVDASVAWHVLVAAGSQILTSRLPFESL